MKILPARDIPPRAVVVVLALVLLARVVGGSDKPPPKSQSVTTAAPQTAEEPGPADALALDLLARARSGRDRPDLFARRSWEPPTPRAAPPAAKPAPPAAPSAPPLPFKYLGRRADGERLVVYLVKGEDTYNASVGDTLDNAYSLESVSETALQFIYVPLGTKQVLSIPPQ